MASAPSADHALERRASVPRRTVVNVLSNWVGQLAAFGVAFLLSPFVVSRLGDTGYGLWTLLTVVTGYMGLLDLGVRGAVTRYVAKFHAEWDDESASELASAALSLFLAAAALAVAVCTLLALFVGDLFHIPAAHVEVARLLMVIGGATVAASLIAGVYTGVVAALQRFDLLNLVDVHVTVLRAAATVIVLYAEWGLVALALVHFAFTLARLMIFAKVARRCYPQLVLWLRRPAAGQLDLIFSYSLYSFLLHVGGSLIYYSDSVVIAAFLPVAYVTHFAIGGNLIEYAKTLTAGISQAVSPLASSLAATNQAEALQKVLLGSAKLSMMLVLPIAITFMVRGGTFIRLWMGPDYQELAGGVLAVLSVSLPFVAANHPAGGVLLGIGKHKRIAPLMILEGLANLGLSIVLVKPFGVVGVALGTTVPRLLTNVVAWPWYVSRAVDLPLSSFARVVWLRPALAAVPFAFCTYMLEQWTRPVGLTVFFSQVGATTLLILPTYWQLCLSDEERLLVTGKLRSVWPVLLAARRQSAP